MNFYSSLILKKENINRKIIKFTLQIFYSDVLEFKESESLLASISVKPDEQFEIKFNLFSSPKFLRIDPGTFYSVQINPTCDIIRLNQQEEIEVISFDLNNSLQKSPDLHLEFINNQTLMVCGFDPWYIFENPFVGSDICIKFTSRIIIGYSE